MALPGYKDIIDLVKKGSTLEAQEKIIELREKALEIQEENLELREKALEIQEENLELKERVQQLEQRLSLQESVYFEEFAYRKEGDQSLFCQRCYDVDGILVRLVHRPTMAGSYHCPQCETPYGEQHVPDFR